MGKQRSNLSQFVQKLVEISIMRAMFVVTKLVQHCVENMIIREKIPLVVGSTQSQLHLSPSSYI